MDDNHQKAIHILLVEDNLADVRLIREAFHQSQFPTELVVVNDGVEALAYLNREAQYRAVPPPDFIILDLNLPKKDGREVLGEIKKHQEWRLIPVLVFTTSQAEEDIRCVYKLHGNCYIQKPLYFDQFLEIVKAMEDFWFAIVKLPQS
jgi:two-component system response regulator